LDRLLAVASLGNLRFGVVPDSTRMPLIPLHPFWIFDDRLVQVETWSAELNITERHEVALYEQVFEQYAQAAAYGPAARRVLAGVLAELAAAPGAVPGAVPGPVSGAISGPVSGTVPHQASRATDGTAGGDPWGDARSGDGTSAMWGKDSQ
jgi:hypothetical protein